MADSMSAGERFLSVMKATQTLEYNCPKCPGKKLYFSTNQNKDVGLEKYLKI